MKIERDVSLAQKTTFRIGGSANYYTEVFSLEELKAALAYAATTSLPVFILGGGSNILVSDEGFSGLVIKNSLRGITFSDYPKTVDCSVYAGEPWEDVVSTTVQRNLQGIENLALIPGSFGGAIVQNIGAYGSEIKDAVQWVDTLDVETGDMARFSCHDCEFAYRNSFFKTKEGKRYVVVKATLRLLKNTPPIPVYKDLVEYFLKNGTENPSLLDVHKAVIEIRKSKLPDVSLVGTAGSFFKNPIIKKSVFIALQKKYPEMPFFPAFSKDDEEYVKIPLAWIIDKVCCLKGYRQGEVGIYEKQALVLVNYENAHQKDIDMLAAFIARSVFEATGIAIEREVESVLG